MSMCRREADVGVRRRFLRKPKWSHSNLVFILPRARTSIECGAATVYLNYRSKMATPKDVSSLCALGEWV